MADVESLKIIEKYDQAVNYLYPIVQNMPRAHGRFRDRVLTVMLEVPGQVYAAARSGQVSRVNLVDGSLAELRWLLRFAAARPRKLITPKQQEVACVHLAEVGKMVGAWTKRLRR